MDNSFLYKTDASIVCVILFFLMLAMVAIGQGLRTKFWKPEETETRGGVNSLLGALFGLWGFILAFTFGMSGSRFETVRSLIVDEASNLRTAILRADLFPDSTRDAYRADFSRFLEARIAYYDHTSDSALFRKAKEDGFIAGKSLWDRTVAQSKQPNLNLATSNMINALTALFDIGTKREGVLKARVPDMIVYMLFSLALAISFIGGFTTPGLHRKEWMVVTVFVLLSAIILYITLDLGRPMRGLIKPDVGQETIIGIRKFLLPG